MRPPSCFDALVLLNSDLRRNSYSTVGVEVVKLGQVVISKLGAATGSFAQAHVLRELRPTIGKAAPVAMPMPFQGSVGVVHPLSGRAEAEGGMGSAKRL